MTGTGRWTCTDGKADLPYLGTALADTQFSLVHKDNGKVDAAFLCKTSIKTVTQTDPEFTSSTGSQYIILTIKEELS